MIYNVHGILEIRVGLLMIYNVDGILEIRVG